MRIQLDETDIKAIAGLIASDMQESGTVRYTSHEIEITVDYFLFTEGYREDDYFNGTGAYIVTSAEVVIRTVESDNGMEVDFDEDKLCHLAEMEIAA